MPFENAPITTEEYERFQLAAIDKEWPLSRRSSQWTIDRERNIYLLSVSRTVPPDRSAHDPFWLIFWKSAYFCFECRQIEHASKENGWRGHQALTRLEVPEQLKAYRSAILADIEAGLATYGTGGIYCEAKGFELKLDVCV